MGRGGSGRERWDDREQPLRPEAGSRLPGPPAGQPGSGARHRPRLTPRRDIEDLLERPRRTYPKGFREVPVGTVLPPIEVPAGKLEALVRRSLTEQHERLVWAEAGDEAVVHLARTRVSIRTGMVLIAIVLQTDDTEPTELVVPLAIGTPQDITGLLAVTPRAPEGPAGLVLQWGDAVIAAAWGALVEVVTEFTGAAGSDERGAPLQAAALVAQDEVLGIVLQAEPNVRRRGGGP